MGVRRRGLAILQRVILFAVAGVTAVFLLHVQTAVQVPAQAGEKATFSFQQWGSASGQYLKQVLKGDLGTIGAISAPGYGQPQAVSKVLRENGPRSALLLTTALVASLTLGTLAGLLTSRFGARWLRPGALTGTLVLLSTPDILVILLLRKLVIWTLSTFDVKLFSAVALGDVTVADLVAPTLALTVLPFAVTARVATVAFDEVYDQLYVRTAVSKGASSMRVIWRHVLKNAWLRIAEASPLITSSLVTGLVVVEYIFYFPGIGRTLGLILEQAFQPRGSSTLTLAQPEAAASIALVLLVGALLTDMLMSLIRLSLDPRLASPELAAASASLPRLSLRGFWQEVGGWLQDLPAKLRLWAWRYRPSRTLRQLWQNPPLLIGLSGVLLLVLMALFGGQLADLRTVDHTPRYVVHNGKVYFPPFIPGLPGYPLGSDVAGRDLLARLLVGARYTLFFTLAVTPVRLLFALGWGLVAGLRGGMWTGSARSLTLMFSALPVVLIPASLLPLRSLATGQATDGPSFWIITAILAVIGIPRLVENIRMQVQSTLVQPFVEGARAAGAGSGRILWRHLLPHLAPHLWVVAAADMAWTLLLLAQLGVFSIFLGGHVFAGFDVFATGTRVYMSRIPDWASMLSRPYDVIYRAPWSLWIPAAAFLAAIISFNLVSEGLRRRSQRFDRGLLSEPHPDPELAPLPARRRAGLEWGATAAMAICFAFLVFQYGGASESTIYAPRELTPLEQARNSLQQVAETVQGTGDSLEIAKATTRIHEVMVNYLFQARKAKLPASQMQEDARGRIDILEISSLYMALQMHVPGARDGTYLAVEEVATGEIAVIRTAERAVRAAAVNTTSGPRLILVGTIPGRDNWVLSAWNGPHLRHIGGAQWKRDDTLIRQIAERLPPEYEISVAEVGGGPYLQSSHPLTSFRIEPNGDLQVCSSPRGPCAQVPWQGDGY